MADAAERQPRRAPAATAVGALAALGTVGAAFMAVSHSGIDMPLLNAPRLPMVAAGFAVGTVLYGLVAWGTFTRRAWAWPAALTINAIGFASTIMPWRGWDRSGVPAVVTLLALVLLISRRGRQAMLYDTRQHEPSRSG